MITFDDWDDDDDGGTTPEVPIEITDLTAANIGWNLLPSPYGITQVSAPYGFTSADNNVWYAYVDVTAQGEVEYFLKGTATQDLGGGSTKTVRLAPSIATTSATKAVRMQYGVEQYGGKASVGNVSAITTTGLKFTFVEIEHDAIEKAAKTPIAIYRKPLIGLNYTAIKTGGITTHLYVKPKAATSEAFDNTSDFYVDFNSDDLYIYPNAYGVAIDFTANAGSFLTNTEVTIQEDVNDPTSDLLYPLDDGDLISPTPIAWMIPLAYTIKDETTADGKSFKFEIDKGDIKDTLTITIGAKRATYTVTPDDPVDPTEALIFTFSEALYDPLTGEELSLWITAFDADGVTDSTPATLDNWSANNGVVLVVVDDDIDVGETSYTVYSVDFDDKPDAAGTVKVTLGLVDPDGADVVDNYFVYNEEVESEPLIETP